MLEELNVKIGWHPRVAREETRKPFRRGRLVRKDRSERSAARRPDRGCAKKERSHSFAADAKGGSFCVTLPVDIASFEYRVSRVPRSSRASPA